MILKIKFLDEKHVNYEYELKDTSVMGLYSALTQIGAMQAELNSEVALAVTRKWYSKLKNGAIILNPKYLNCSIQLMRA